MALILAATRRKSEAERLIRSKAAWSWRLDFMLGAGVQSKTLGIVGLGEIGLATARRARAFGMDVLYTGRRPSSRADEVGATFVETNVLCRPTSSHCTVL